MTMANGEPSPEDVQKMKRVELARRAVVVGCVAWVVGMSVAVLYGLVLLRSTQLAGVQRSKDTLAIAADARAAAVSGDKAAKRIEDCTTFGRACFQEGQRRTKAAVGDIGKVTVLAAACSIGVDPALPVAQRQTIIEVCIKARLNVPPRR